MFEYEVDNFLYAILASIEKVENRTGQSLVSLRREIEREKGLLLSDLNYRNEKVVEACLQEELVEISDGVGKVIEDVVRDIAKKEMLLLCPIERQRIEDILRRHGL